MSSSLYPLTFQPRFVEKIWGGQKLATILGKKIPPAKQIGESWELYDFPPGVVENSSEWLSAIVANGPLEGRTLHQLVVEFGKDLLGDVRLVGEHGQFPILVKFLDAREDLSVQVHPSLEYAADHRDAHLKTEAWYVMQHEPAARILKGLIPNVSRDQFAAGIESGTVDQLIRAIPVKEGDCHFLPSGTVHALGAGILVAEIQTPSDTTFRVFDFNRLENGKPRKLHVAEALECIDFSGKAEVKQIRSHVAGYFTTVTRLVKSNYFQIEKVRMTEGVEEPVPYDQPVVWMMLAGEAQVRVKSVSEPTMIKRGQTVLLPARMDTPIIKTLSDCQWLEVTFPSSSAPHIR